jgi:hypothetical protein
MSEKAIRAVEEFMRQKLDGAFTTAFYGAATGAGTAALTKWDDEANTLTVEKIDLMLSSLPPRETWALSKMFPPGVATICKTPDESLTLLHPGDWPRIEREWNQSLSPEQRHNPFYGLRAMELDPYEDDSPETAEWRRKERARVLGLLSATISATAQLSEIVRPQ